MSCGSRDGLGPGSGREGHRCRRSGGGIRRGHRTRELKTRRKGSVDVLRVATKMATVADPSGARRHPGDPRRDRQPRLQEA